jgi:hypothetical protein
MRRNANGLEAQLEELNARTWKYLNSRSDYLIDRCFNEQQHEAIYFVDLSQGELDPCMTIIASDPVVMKEIC